MTWQMSDMKIPRLHTSPGSQALLRADVQLSVREQYLVFLLDFSVPVSLRPALGPVPCTLAAVTYTLQLQQQRSCPPKPNRELTGVSTVRPCTILWVFTLESSSLGRAKLSRPAVPHWDFTSGNLSLCPLRTWEQGSTQRRLVSGEA